MPCRKRRPALRRKVLLLLALATGAVAAPTEDPAYALVPEPSFMWHEHGQAVPGSRKTVLVPALVTRVGLRVLAPGAFRELGVPWEAFSKKAGATAAAHLVALEPEVFRDASGDATHAVARSENPLTASTLFAPGFLERFAPVFGDRLLAAIPDRFTLYVFPRGFGTFREQGKKLATLYEDAVYPASIELFEVDSEGVRAVGSFENRPEDPKIPKK